jgi:hypothetical protein
MDIFEAPVASLAQPRLSPQVIDLQVKLGLFVRWFGLHCFFSPLFSRSANCTLFTQTY